MMNDWILWTGMIVLVTLAWELLRFYCALARWCYSFLKEVGRG